VQKNVSLKSFNTFGIDVKATAFTAVTSVVQLQELLHTYKADDIFVLGGGSNMLLKGDVHKFVIHIALRGIEIIQETDTHVHLKVMAGENWHSFVQYCVENDLGGVENLSLIPGNVGTSPIQNIGAYGVELKDTFLSCEAVSRETGEVRTFSLEACKFDYRDSIFKNEAKDAYIITAVTFKLTKKNHVLHTEYGAIQEVLDRNGIQKPTLRDVSQAVIQIRQSKLPDPLVLGNSGSFFKNPIIDQEAFTALRKAHPEVPYYPVGENKIKVPAGWLIEQAGFKGKRFGDAGVHDKQALVLVNHGNASGEEIWNLAMKIQKEVHRKFGLTITPEVNII